VDVNLTDGQAHRVSLYCLDWDNRGRNEGITVGDAATGIALDTQTLTAFSGGTYLTWAIKGHVVFHIVSPNDYAVLGALFFGVGQGTAATGPGKVRFYPRFGSAARMVGGRFQGSNDGSAYTDLYTITGLPADGAYTEVPLTVDPKTYRYLRYLSPAGSYGNVAEIEFYSGTGAQALKLSGKGYGSAGSFNNSGATFQSALDGDTTTSFDGPTADGNFVGIDQQGPQMTLTPAGVAAGFTLTTFATGFPQMAGQIGPLGIALAGSRVMVADGPGNVRLFPADTDGQVAGNSAPSVTPASSFGQLNANGLASLGGTLYLAQQGLGRVIRLNANGTPVTDANAVVASIAHATGLVANPVSGHLFVSVGGGAGQIWDVDPTTNAAAVWSVSVPNADGLAVSADGKTLYAAQDSDILGFDIASRTQVWDYNATASHTAIAAMDGIALGFGALAGMIYANTNDGTVWQISLSSGAATEIASGGTRGDFVAPDASGQGSLLLTQSDRIMRLAPFPAAGGGGPALSSLAVSPGAVTGGQPSTGTVTLTGTAPAGGITVALSSGSASALVPASVLVAAGQATATFPITTSPVSADTAVLLSASYGGTTKPATLTVLAPVLNPSCYLRISSSRIAH